MPAALLQLDPTIPVTTPHGKGHALGWLDYGAEGELFWIVADAKTGQVWIMPTSLVRMQANISMGRTHPEPPPADNRSEKLRSIKEMQHGV